MIASQDSFANLTFPLLASESELTALFIKVRYVQIGIHLDIVAADHLEHRAAQDAEVQQQRTVLHVPDVASQAPVPAKVVAAVDLGPAGDAGQQIEPLLFALREIG